jgi:hypothetical protein
MGEGTVPIGRAVTAWCKEPAGPLSDAGSRLWSGCGSDCLDSLQVAGNGLFGATATIVKPSSCPNGA